MACCVFPAPSNSLGSKGKDDACYSGRACRSAAPISLSLLGKHPKKRRSNGSNEKDVKLGTNNKISPVYTNPFRVSPSSEESKQKIKASVKMSKCDTNIKVPEASQAGVDKHEQPSENSVINKINTPKRRRAKPKPKKPDSGENTDDEDDSDDSQKKYKCKTCGSRFLRLWRLKAHMERHTQQRSFKCDIEGCDKAYSYQQHLDRHKSLSHSDLVITVSKIMCPVPECKALLASSLNLKKHFQRFHDESSFKYPCTECGKKFKKHRQLSLHLMAHVNEPPFRCNICNVGAMTEAALKQHLKKHKVHHCSVPGCDITFDNYSALRKHKAEHNTSFSSFKCAHCDKVYNCRTSLVEHVMTHIDNNSSVFHCSYEGCSRVYFQKRNLNHHIRFYHEKKTRFMCTWEGCGKPCHTQKKLEFHLNIHKNGKVPTKRSGKPRAKRKDAGQKKRAAASLLSGVTLSRDIEKTLLTDDRENTNNSHDSSAEEEECLTLYRKFEKVVTPDKRSDTDNVVSESSQENVLASNNVSLNGNTQGLETQNLDEMIENQSPNIGSGVKIYVADAKGCVNDIDIDVEDLQQSSILEEDIEVLDNIDILETLDGDPSLSDVEDLQQSSILEEDIVVLDNIDILNTLDGDPFLSKNMIDTSCVESRDQSNEVCVSETLTETLEVMKNSIDSRSLMVEPNPVSNLLFITNADTYEIMHETTTGQLTEQENIAHAIEDLNVGSMIYSYLDNNSNRSVPSVSSNGYSLTLCSETVIDDPGCGSDLQVLCIVPPSEKGTLPLGLPPGSDCQVCHVETDMTINDTTNWPMLMNDFKSLVCFQSSNEFTNSCESSHNSKGCILNLAKKRQENVSIAEKHQSEFFVDNKEGAEQDPLNCCDEESIFQKKLHEVQTPDCNGDGMQKHIESDREELQGPSKEDEDEENASGENSSGSRDDSGSDDEYLPAEDEEFEFSGEEDGDGDQDDDDDDDDEEDEEDDDQDEQPDDDDEDEEDNEDGGANQGELNHNDDNNNSDHVNDCDNGNDSDSQIESDSNESNFVDDSATGLDRSGKQLENEDEVGDHVDSKKDPSVCKNKMKSADKESKENAKGNSSATCRSSKRVRFMKDQGNVKKKVMENKKSPSNKSKNPKKKSKQQAASAKKRSYESDSSDDVPLIKKIKEWSKAGNSNNEAAPNHSKKLPFPFQPHTYKVCSRFSEAMWIDTLKKASEFLNLTDISED